jgi:hypothetical protein
MSYFKQVIISDTTGNTVLSDATGSLRVAKVVRLAGNAFVGSTLDPNFISSAVTGSGSATQSGGVITLVTGATANSTASIATTAVARHFGAASNEFAANIQLGDTGTANNTRRWGAFNGTTDGFYFKLSGSVLNVAAMAGGVETAIPSGSWNASQTVPALTNINLYSIIWTPARTYFFINGVLVHLMTATTAYLSGTLNLPVWIDNVNSGGSITNVSIAAGVAVIARLGEFETQPVYFHLTTAGTYVLKYSAGKLHRITLGVATGTLMTLYDNTSGSGPVITSINTPSQANALTLHYGLEFNTGLTVVSTGTWDATIIYD